MKKDYYLFIKLAQYVTKKILHHKLQQINKGLKKSTVGMKNGAPLADFDSCFLPDEVLQVFCKDHH